MSKRSLRVERGRGHRVGREVCVAWPAGARRLTELGLVVRDEHVFGLAVVVEHHLVRHAVFCSVNGVPRLLLTAWAG